jgi:hypothetical protein
VRHGVDLHQVSSQERSQALQDVGVDRDEDPPGGEGTFGYRVD